MKKMIKIEYDVEVDTDGCIKCPFKRFSQDGNATLTVCNHPKCPHKGYQNVISNFVNRPDPQTPDWCPLGFGTVETSPDEPSRIKP